jgi:hypothetical protein
MSFRNEGQNEAHAAAHGIVSRALKPHEDIIVGDEDGSPCFIRAILT